MKKTTLYLGNLVGLHLVGGELVVVTSWVAL